MKKYWIIIFASLLFTGCAMEYAETTPDEEVVTRPAPPYDGAVWIGVEYNWVGGRYVTVPAHWERPHGRWVGGQWNKSRRGYHWQRGHWR